MADQALHSLLCCLVALVLGLEPAGSALYAASSHAPALPICRTERARVAGASGEPLLAVPPARAPSALVPPARDAGHSLGPRTFKARRNVRAELTHGQRWVERSRSPAPAPARTGAPLAPAEVSQAVLGPPGARSAHGAARAAALGALLL